MRRRPMSPLVGLLWLVVCGCASGPQRIDWQSTPATATAPAPPQPSETPYPTGFSWWRPSPGDGAAWSPSRVGNSNGELAQYDPAPPGRLPGDVWPEPRSNWLARLFPPAIGQGSSSPAAVNMNTPAADPEARPMAVADGNLLADRSQPPARPRPSRADDDVRAARVSGKQDDNDGVLSADARDTQAGKPSRGEAARPRRVPSREWRPPHSLPDTTTGVALDISKIDTTPQRVLSKTDRLDPSASNWQPVAVAAPSTNPAREQATADDESAHARGEEPVQSEASVEHANAEDEPPARLNLAQVETKAQHPEPDPAAPRENEARAEARARTQAALAAVTQAEMPPWPGLVPAPVTDSPWASSSRRHIESLTEAVVKAADEPSPAPRAPLSPPPPNPSTHSEQPPKNDEIFAADVVKIADQRSPALPSPLLPSPSTDLNPSTHSGQPAKNHEPTTEEAPEKSTVLADNRDDPTAPKSDQAEAVKSRVALAPGSSELPEMMPVPLADVPKPLAESRAVRGKTLSPRHGERMASRTVDRIYASPPPVAPAPRRRFLGLFTIEDREPPAPPRWPAVTFPTSYYAAANTGAASTVSPAAHEPHFAPAVMTTVPEKKPSVITAWLQKFKPGGGNTPKYGGNGCHHGGTVPCCAGCTCHSGKPETAATSVSKPRLAVARSPAKPVRQRVVATTPEEVVAEETPSTSTEPGDVTEEGKLFERVSFERFDKAP